MRGIGLKSSAEWKAYCGSGVKPADIPSRPDKVFARDGWAGLVDWLGYVREGRRNEARSDKAVGEAPAPADAPS